MLLIAHTDVTLPGMKELWEDKNPWSGKVKDGKIFGRGSGDDKSGLTAQIMALDEIILLHCQPSIHYGLCLTLS